MKANNLKPYLPFGSMQTPRLFSRLRNAWVAFVTAPNQLSISILNDYSESITKIKEAEDYLACFKCPALTPCYKCKDKVECSEALAKVVSLREKTNGKSF